MDLSALIAAAMVARGFADHYRSFNVGCAGFSHSSGIALLGANSKPKPDAVPVCAEMKVMTAAARLGVTLDHIVVVGRLRAEDTTATLHCCGERCRPLMRGFLRQGKGVILPETKIICVHPDTRAIQTFTVVSLMEAHGENLDS